MLKRIKVIVITLLLLTIPTYTYAYSDYIVASGENIGIKLKSKGIIVMGRYDDTNPELSKGDMIVSVNGNDNIDISSFTDLVSNNSKDTIEIGYIRNGKLKTGSLKVNSGKTGLYLKDTIVGIGTLTFIDPKTKIYGALGHEIVDSISGLIIDSKSGDILESKVLDVKRSDYGNPGEKNASIDSDSVLGDIDTNTNKGLFGDFTDKLNNNKLYKVAQIDEIKQGQAYMLTELEDNKVGKYSIEITGINTHSNVKNITFKVTDEKLLDVGGIVQGMSGSPIIQGDYIIGAVTHVVLDNPKKGYGILITNMLEEAEKKDD